MLDVNYVPSTPKPQIAPHGAFACGPLPRYSASLDTAGWAWVFCAPGIQGVPCACG